MFQDLPLSPGFWKDQEANKAALGSAHMCLFHKGGTGRAQSPRRCHQRRHSEPQLGDYRIWFWAGLGLWGQDEGQRGNWQKGQPSIWGSTWGKAGGVLQAREAWLTPAPTRLPAASSRSRRAPKRNAHGQARTPALHTLQAHAQTHSCTAPAITRHTGTRARRRAHASVHYLRCVRAPQPEGNRRNDYSSERSRLPSRPPASRARGDTRWTRSTPGSRARPLPLAPRCVGFSP